MRIPVVFAAAALLLGCMGPPNQAGGVRECRDCGTVRSIEQVAGTGQTSGAGALAGAVIGGVIGHQFGSGRGNDAATAAGAVGGAVAGNEMERQSSTGRYYQVLVKMDEGGSRLINVAALNGLREGDRVRVSGQNLEMLGG
jgi:outer membrane lipoprotein SlyB